MKPGKSVVIVGTGPVVWRPPASVMVREVTDHSQGLSAVLTAKLLSPSLLIAVDKDPGRLEAAQKMGADHIIDASGDVKAKVMELTGGRGCDVVIEAVGVPAAFELCQDLVAFGGNIANVGVHGAPCQLHIEKLWGYNIGKRRPLPDEMRTDRGFSHHHGFCQHDLDGDTVKDVRSRHTEPETANHSR